MNISTQQLDELKQGEYYTPNEGHLKYAQDNIPLDQDTFEFLGNRRIEINAVKNVAGAEKLWNWIIKRLEEIYPNRNYNRAIKKPELHWFRPRPLDQLGRLIDRRISSILEPEIVRCEVQLSDYHGFIDDVPTYEQQLYWSFERVLNGNGSTGVFTSGERSTAKYWLKNITKDIAGLVRKYDGKVM